LDDVLQISNVFVNVSKGEVAKAGDLQKAFGTTEVPDIVKEVSVHWLHQHLSITFSCQQILKKGEVQVNEKEREHDLTSLRKEIATLVAEKCVEPATQKPYPVGMIEKAMAEAGFSVKQNKIAKSQVVGLISPRKASIEIFVGGF
jgi:ribosome maturation protein SDO1